MDQRNTPPGEALPASALPLPHEVLVWRGMKATPTVVLIDAFVVGDQLEKALIEETARRRRAEVLLFATQQAYVREHGKASVVPSETASRLAPPTEEEIAAYRDLFRSEIDKNMHNSSGSPSTDAHRVALHKFVEARNAHR